jgi:putative zinc finger/helix-turn-helix YgiT family protein
MIGMNCLRCQKGRLQPAVCTFKVTVRDEEVAVRTEGLRCDSCGWETQDLAGAADLAQMASDAYRRKHRLLTSDQLKARRERLGMAQEAFAGWLSVGIASVKRWEGAHVQERAMDELIRLKTDPEALADAAKAVRARLAKARAGRTPKGQPKSTRKVRIAR